MMDRMSQPPLNCLTPLAYHAVSDFLQNTNVSPELALTNVISAMAGATHGLMNVEAAPGMELPLSLMGIAIAESGGGKTVCEKKITAGFRRFDADMAERFVVEKALYQSELDAHEAVRKGILKKIKEVTKDFDGDCQDLSEELLGHDQLRPIPPVRVRTYCNDATLAGLISTLSGWPNVSYINDEAAFLIENRLGDAISFINSCFSGTPVYQETGKRRVSISAPRLNMLIQMQPSVFDRMQKKHGERLDDEGFYARAIMCYSISRHPVSGVSRLPCWTGVDLFNDRVHELLKASVSDDGRPISKRVLRFDRDAQLAFDQERGRVNLLRQLGGCLHAFPALAAKIPENLAKLAAIFHAFEKLEGDISLHTLQNAMSLYGWYVDEHIRIFSQQPALPQENQDAFKLMVWLANYVRTHSEYSMPRNFLLKNGPRATRSAVRLRAALIFLWQRGVLWEHVLDGSKEMHVFLHQHQFQPHQLAYWCGPSPSFPM